MNSRFDSGLIADFMRPQNQMHASKGLFAEYSSGTRQSQPAAYKVGPWPRFREIAPKSLHDDHTARLAWCMRRS